MTTFEIGLLIGLWLGMVVVVLSCGLGWLLFIWWMDRPEPRPRPNRKLTIVEWLLRHHLVR